MNKHNLKTEGYRYCKYLGNGQHLLQIEKTGELEVWFANKNHASYGLVYKNTHLEFARSISLGDVARIRLQYLRGEIEKERISYSELDELQELADYIEPGDVVLAEWAGIPENTFLSNGSHLCTDCGIVEKNNKMTTVDDNDYCLNCV